MKYFLYRLNPPRPTFPVDITRTEGKLMQEHLAYWSDLMKKGLVIAFGPVADPKGSYGVGIIQLQDDSDPNALGVNDPVIKANVGFDFAVPPVPRLVLPDHHA